VKNKQSLSAWSRAVHSSNTEQDRRVQNQDQISDVGETTKQHDPLFEIQSDGYWNRKSGQNNRHVNAIVSGPVASAATCRVCIRGRSSEEIIASTYQRRHSAVCATAHSSCAIVNSPCSGYLRD